MKNSMTIPNHYFDTAHQKHGGINDDSFTKNTALLLVVQRGKHMILAQRLENGDIELHSTYGSPIRHFTSLHSFISSRDELKTFDGDDRPLSYFARIFWRCI